jgi:hypothetical protein
MKRGELGGVIEEGDAEMNVKMFLRVAETWPVRIQRGGSSSREEG